MLAALSLATLALAGWLAIAAIPPAPVKIGLVAPFSGRDALLGQQLIGAVRLALSDRAGRARDRAPVELVAYDDASDPELIARQAEKLAVDPQLMAVLGHPTLVSATAGLPIYQAANLPALLLAPRLSPTQTAAPIMAVGPDQATLTAALNRFTTLKRARQVVPIVADSAEADLLAETLLPAADPQSRQPSRGQPEAAVAQILSSNPDAVVYVGDALTGARYLTEVRQAGWSGAVLVVLSQGTAGDLAAVGGSAAGNVYYLAALPWVEPEPNFEPRFRQATGLAPWPEAVLLYQMTAQLLDRVDSRQEPWVSRRRWETTPDRSAHLTTLLTESRVSFPRTGVGIFELESGQYPGRLVEAVPSES